MRPTFRALTAGLTVVSMLAFGLTIEQSAGAVGALPSTVSEVVSVGGTLGATGCPTFTGTPPVYSTLAAAITAATAGNTIYVCAGNYNLTTGYGSNDQAVVNKSLTLDGYNWDVPPTPTDTSASVNSSTQSELSLGSGILVQSSNVTIQGFTFFENNGVGDTNAESIDVQSNVSGPGDQGYNNVTVADNLFADTGGAAPLQNGDVHFGLGMDATASGTGSPADVTALDTGDVVQYNVFAVDAGFENNAVQLSDTNGALVTENTVNYPATDDNSLSALWFPGFDKLLTVSDNTLNGGGIDSDGAVPDLSDPKSGIKVVDEDPSDAYGDGCTGQTISGNTILGFVNGISMISTGLDVDSQALCNVGPSDFSVANNTITNSAVYGIYVSLASPATGASVTDNTVSDTDPAGQSSLGYPAGDYPYFDNSTTFLGDTWSGNSGASVVRPQTITWTPPGAQTWVSGGAGTFTLSAGSDESGTTLTFASSTTSVCTVSGTTVTMLTPGTCTITPTAPGSSTGSWAITMGSPSNITINGTTQTITWTPPGAQTWVSGGAGTFPLGTATDTSGSTVTFASSTTSVCTVSGTTVTMLTPGTCTITPTAPASGSYSTFVGSPSNITINDASQTITWTPPGSETWVTGGAGTFSLSGATDTSGSTVTFASSTTSVCTVSGTTVTMLTPGTCTITPTAPASGNYSAFVGLPSNITINAPGGSSGGGTTTTTTTTTTLPPPPVTTTTIAPRPSVSLSAVRHSGNVVIVSVHCSTARCAGIAELTKTIRVKVEIGRTGKYRTVTETVLLGRISYARAAGSSGQVKIHLTATGLKLLRAADGHRYSCVLTVTSRGGPKRETVSLTT